MRLITADRAIATCRLFSSGRTASARATPSMPSLRPTALSRSRSMPIDAHFPAALQPLFEPKRYKVLYGGRGGGKSWGIATYLLSQANSRPTRILCCREYQTSIRESVHRLLSDMIRTHGLGHRFKILDTAIREVRNGQEVEGGSEFIFEGLRHNAGKIR